MIGVPRPWYRKRGWVLALLLFVPPLGIALLWWGQHFQRQVRIGLTVASALFFIAMVTAKPKKIDDETARSSTAGSSTPAAATGSPAEAPKSGAELAEKEPRLLVPVNLNGFRLVEVPKLSECCNVVAYYQQTDGQRNADVHIGMAFDTKLPTVDKQHRAVKVGKHNGVSFIDTAIGLTRPTITWHSMGWEFIVKVPFKKAGDRAEAIKAAEQIALQVATHADRYLASPAPDEIQRKQQLVAVADAVEVEKRLQEADKLRRRPEQFITAVRNTGVGANLVVRAERDDLLGDRLLITVGSLWHRQHKQDRLMAAQALWTLWAKINSPNEPDNSRIQLLDANGNEVGGSDSVLGGSSIAVQD